jgi:predicted ATP-binding protein involved in virulence
LKDSEEKLAVFDDLLERIELFQGIIGANFLHKTFKVDQGAGFLLYSTKGDQLSPIDLSSGEQHELVLMYELLFGVPTNSLILIDEPELSLHISWQHKFLDDLARISQVANLDFLIATHSPQIVHTRWHLTVALDPDDLDA